MRHRYTFNSYVNVKRRVLMLSGILGAVLVGIIVTSLFLASTLSTASNMVNVLGKQRMYTQAIGKNASRVYVLYTAIASDEFVQSEPMLAEKVVYTKATLAADSEAFDNVLSQLSEGYIFVNGNQRFLSERIINGIREDIIRLTQLWKPYYASVNVIVNSEKVNHEVDEALIVVNENNEKLLDYAQNITNTFDTLSSEQYAFCRNLLYMMIFIFTIIALFLIYSMYRYLFSSLDVLYGEIAKLGINHSEVATTDIERATLTDEIKILLSGFSETLELVERINASNSFNETLKYIYDSFSRYLPYTYIGIALLKDKEPMTLVASYGIGEKHHPGLAKDLINHEAVLSETSLGKIMADSKPRVINDMDEYFKRHLMKSYSKVIMDHGIKSSITLPLKANGMPLGFIFFSSDQKNVYHDKHIQYLKFISNFIALAFDKNIFSDELLYSGVLALAKLSEARDEDTGEHLIRISRYVEKLAVKLSETDKYRYEIDQTYIQDLVKFSPMHDIGKVGVPDDILLKPGKLTSEEFEIMKTHTLYGANVLNEAEKNIKRSGKSMFSMGIDIAHYHHEKFDGSGYPEGLFGEAIPLAPRIVAIADVFDALMSKRPYKEPFSLEKTLAIMREGRGKHFDPFILDVFMENIEEFCDIQKHYQGEIEEWAEENCA